MTFISGIVFSESSEFDLGENLFRIKRKITVHHPGVIRRLLFKNNFNRFTFMLAEIKNFRAVFIHNDPSGKISIIVEGAEISKLLNIVFKILIPVKLSLKHLISGWCIGFCTVSIMKFLISVE